MANDKLESRLIDNKNIGKGIKLGGFVLAGVALLDVLQSFYTDKTMMQYIAPNASFIESYVLDFIGFTLGASIAYDHDRLEKFGRKSHYNADK